MKWTVDLHLVSKIVFPESVVNSVTFDIEFADFEHRLKLLIF